MQRNVEKYREHELGLTILITINIKHDIIENCHLSLVYDIMMKLE